MKKLTLWILVLSILVCCFSGCASDGSETTEAPDTAEAPTLPVFSCKVAMISDYGDITSEEFPRLIYETGRDWCAKYDIPYTYYIPAEDSTAERTASVEQAIREGANVLLLPGYRFGELICESAELYPDVYFIALDVTMSDIIGWDSEETVLPPNVVAFTYREEIAGFLAGYAAVKMGYSDLAFIGYIPVPAVVRYGFGFVQGADYAAKESAIYANMKYGYVQCFCGLEQNHPLGQVDTWFREGLDAAFFFNEHLYTHMSDFDRPYDMKIIVADKHQSESVDGLFGEGTFLTAAMKNYSATVSWALSKLILEGDWDSLGGTLSNLGLVSSTELEKNHVSLSDSTQWNESFTKEDYAAIVEAILTGSVTVDDSIECLPRTSNLTIADMVFLD